MSSGRQKNDLGRSRGFSMGNANRAACGGPAARFPFRNPGRGRGVPGLSASSKTLLSGLFRRPVLLPDQPVFSIGVFEFRDNPVARFFFCRNDQAWLLIVQCCHECVLGSINFNTDRSFCCVGRKDKLVSSGPRESNHSFGDSTAG